MANEQLINYIKDCLSKGFSSVQIKQALKESGWKEEDVDASFRETLVNETKKEPSIITPPSEEEPRMEIVERPKKKFSFKIFFLVLFIIFLITAGSIYAFYVVPIKSFKDAVENTIVDWDENSKYLEADIEAEVGLKMKDIYFGSSTYSSGNLKVNFKSINDNSDKNILRFDYTADASVSVKGNDGKEQDLSVNLEFKTEDKVFYAILKDLQGSLLIGDFNEAEQEFMEIVLQQVKGQWLKKDIKGDQELEATYDQLVAEINKQKQESIESFNKYKEDFYKIAKVKYLGTEKIDSDACYHYYLTLNKEELKSYLTKVIKEQQDPTASYYDENWEQKFNDAYENDIWPIIEKVEIEAWVNKKDLFFKKYSLKLDAEISQEDIPFSSINFNIVGLLNKLKAEEINIGAPENAKDVEQLMSEVFGAGSIDIKIKTDMDQLKTTAEIYKTQKGTYVGFIYGSTDAKSLYDGLNSLDENKVLVYANKTKYCVTKKLETEGAGYWCIDSSGYSNSTEIIKCTQKTYSCQ